MKYLVTKELLDLHDKYDGDLGLLDERWAAKEDRELFNSAQVRALYEYLEQLHLSQSDLLSTEFRQKVECRIDELEALIDPDVVTILRGRVC